MKTTHQRKLHLSTSALLVALVLVGCASSRVQPPPASASAVTCPPDESDAAPTPTIADLNVLRRADQLLSEPATWMHTGDRNCRAAARAWDLYCALDRASLDVLGVACHRSAAMQEVRRVIDERTRGVELAHRLMDYNNLPTTTFADIKGVLAAAIRRLEDRLRAS
jgi:hypothetical protein